ncbi:MAG TPA: O-antigen ligase family protein, partial [Candidatus Omnitrophota bacterium]|nr:O-antigen ligase family protein [Candidatus Omnitrophota bacterium]
KEDLVYSIILMSCSLVLFFINKGLEPKKENIARILPASLLLFSLYLSMFFSVNVENSIIEFYKLATCASVFLCVLSLPENKKIKLLVALSSISILVSIRAIQWVLTGAFRTLDWLTMQKTGFEFPIEYLQRGRAFVPFVFPSELAGYLILFIPIGLALLESQPKDASPETISIKNIFSILIVTTSTLALISTQSLGAIISLALSTLLFFLFQNKNLARFVPVFGLSLLVILWLVHTRDSTAYDHNKPWLSIANRFSYWEHAVRLIAAHPFVGLGQGNYPFFKGSWAHNSYLQAWAEFGILGIMSLLGMAIVTIKINFKELKENRRLLISGAWTGSLAFLIHNLVDSTLLRPAISVQWWAIAAVLAGYFRFKSSK